MLLVSLAGYCITALTTPKVGTGVCTSKGLCESRDMYSTCNSMCQCCMHAWAPGDHGGAEDQQGPAVQHPGAAQRAGPVSIHKTTS